jgi:AraC-like DNA-binding protein
MKKIELNAYNETEHWIALNERNIYLSYTEDDQQSFMNHVHSSCELLLVEQGGADYTIDNLVYHLQKHDLFIIGAMDPHLRTMTDYPFIRYGLTFMPAYVGSFPIINEYVNIYSTQKPENFIKLKNIEEDEFEKLRNIFLRLGEESTQIQSNNSDMIYALLLQLTIILKRRLNYGKLNLAGNNTYQSMLNIRSYIDANYCENLSLNELSKKFYLQPNTISRDFRSCFSININNYINSVRITNAVSILEKSSISITDLASQVGYTSINTFIRQFGTKMGLSPYQYRKKFIEYMINTQARHYKTYK